MREKQDAFVTGVAAAFYGARNSYCQNHFVRDLAQPVLEEDSHAKVQMRRKVRGLRTIEREVLAQQQPEQPPVAQTSSPVQPLEMSPANPPHTNGVLPYCPPERDLLTAD